MPSPQISTQFKNQGIDKQGKFTSCSDGFDCCVYQMKVNAILIFSAYGHWSYPWLCWHVWVLNVLVSTLTAEGRGQCYVQSMIALSIGSVCMALQ